VGGIVTETDLLSKLVEGLADLSSAVAEVMIRSVHTVEANDDASVLTDLFANGFVALVVNETQRPLGILTKMDLVDHLTSSPENWRDQ